MRLCPCYSSHHRHQECSLEQSSDAWSFRWARNNNVLWSLSSFCTWQSNNTIIPTALPSPLMGSTELLEPSSLHVTSWGIQAPEDHQERIWLWTALREKDWSPLPSIPTKPFLWCTVLEISWVGCTGWHSFHHCESLPWPVAPHRAGETLHGAAGSSPRSPPVTPYMLTNLATKLLILDFRWLKRKKWKQKK